MPNHEQYSRALTKYQYRTFLTCIERLGRSLQYVERKRRNDVSLSCDRIGSMNSFGAHRGDHLCTVDECDALFRTEFQRAEIVSFQNLKSSQVCIGYVICGQ